MKFLANENILHASVIYLKSRGFDLTAVGVDHPGISDQEVMEIAMKEGRTIITYDSDYGELIFKHGYRPHSGIIFIRFQPTEPLETAKILEQLVATDQLSFNSALTVIDSNSIRQKKY